MRVSETNSDTTTPKVTTSAKLRKNCPMIPEMKATGAKMQTSDRVAAMTAKTTSLLPLMAAETGSGSSSSRWRKMFSSTTMASSTTTPMSSKRASKVRELSVKPAK